MYEPCLRPFILFIIAFSALTFYHLLLEYFFRNVVMCTDALTIPHTATVYLKNAAARIPFFPEHEKNKSLFLFCFQLLLVCPSAWKVGGGGGGGVKVSLVSCCGSLHLRQSLQ